MLSLDQVTILILLKFHFLILFKIFGVVFIMEY